MNIDEPDIRRRLWAEMRSDLISLVPSLKGDERLICPLCGRLLPFQDFSLEHILPKQALKCDPAEIRKRYTQNERAGLTLTCKKQLIIRGNKISENGCNGWKGSHYDKAISDTMKYSTNKLRSSRHLISSCVVSYLGLFKLYGYSVVLILSGAIMRRQFLFVNKFCSEFPIRSQMLLAGGVPEKAGSVPDSYWSRPFWVTLRDDGQPFCNAGYRSVSVMLPLSRDPRIPISHAVPYVPSRYIFRPNFQTFID